MMDTAGLHPGAEFRVGLLRERITDLKIRLKRESGLESIDDRIEIEHLERRYRALRERLDALNLEGGGFRATFKSALLQVAFDVGSSVGEFVKRLDANYRARLLRKAV
jgi:hypothetical protein